MEIGSRFEFWQLLGIFAPRVNQLPSVDLQSMNGAANMQRVTTCGNRSLGSLFSNFWRQVARHSVREQKTPRPWRG